MCSYHAYLFTQGNIELGHFRDKIELHRYSIAHWLLLVNLIGFALFSYFFISLFTIYAI